MNRNLHKKYSGVIVPMVSPLLINGNVDQEGVCRIVDLLLASQSCPFILGTTGEAPSLNASQKMDIAKTVVDRVNKQCLVYAGISSTCIDDSIADAKEFAAMGVDVVVATLPAYYPMSNKQIVSYFKHIADVSPLPLIIYNMPATVKISIPLEVIQELSKHPNIVGLKDSERNEERMHKALELWKDREDFSYLIGWAAKSSVAMLNGADGLVPSTGNFAPELYNELLQHALKGEVELSNQLQEKTNELSALYQKDRILSESIPALKAMMFYLGICDKHVMPPMYAMDSEEEKEYFDFLKSELNGVQLKCKSNETATK